MKAEVEEAEAEVEAKVETAAKAEVEAELQTAAIAALEASVQTLQSVMGVNKSALAAVLEQLADLWAPRVRALAAQLLLLACERETLRTAAAAATNCFQQMGVDHIDVCALAADMAVEPAQVVSQADAVISRQNAGWHVPFVSLAELEQEVEVVQRSITPQLQDRCRWECIFIKAYPDIKRAFPTRFI